MTEEDNKKNHPSPLGDSDNPRLLFPKQITARQHELQLLQNQYQAVCEGGMRIAFIKGFAGTGKTTLVHAFRDAVHRNGGIFIASKYDQYKNDPYDTLRQPFDQLAHYTLALEQRDFTERKDQIEKAVASYAALLIQFSPQWERVIQKAFNDSAVNLQEKRTILIGLLSTLITLFTSNDTPLVLFIDDLQWMDDGSSQLLTELLCARTPDHLLFVGAYREEEIDETQPFWQLFLHRKAAKTITMNTIAIRSFDLRETTEFLEGALSVGRERVKALSELALHLTGGNPLQVKEFLHNLLQEGMLYRGKNGWQWDDEQIHNAYSESAGKLSTQRIHAAEAEVRDLLMITAGIGGEFSLFEAIVASDRKEEEVSRLINKAVLEGFLLPAGQTSSFLSRDSRFRFAHDILRQTFYDLIPENRRAQFHLMIAQRFEQDFDKRRKGELYGLAYHYNKARDLVQTREEIRKLLRLNYAASKAAFSALAWERAYEYAAHGIALLQQYIWDTDYSLAKQVLEIGIEAAFLSAHYPTMNRWIHILENRTTEPGEKARAWKIRVQALVAQRSLSEAVNATLSYCARLGRPVNLGVFASWWRWNPFHMRVFLKRALREKNVFLQPLPEQEACGYIDTIIVALSSSYIINQRIFSAFVWIIIKDIIGFRRTHSSSGYAYICFGVVLINRGEYEDGYRVARVGIEIIEHSFSLAEKAQGYMFFCILIHHWKEHIRETFPLFEKGYEAGCMSGSFEHASYCLTVMCFYKVLSADADLETLEREMDESLERVKEVKQERNIAVLTSTRQWLRCLRGKTKSCISFDDETFSETEHVKHTQETADKSHMATYLFTKLFTAYLLGRYEDALEYALETEKLLYHIVEQVHGGMFYYLYGLTLIALSSCGSRSGYRREIRKCISKVQRFALATPVNFEHRMIFLNAEWERLQGRPLQALTLYAKANAKARGNGSLCDLGLINERSGLLLKELGLECASRAHLREAYEWFWHWDALGKVFEMHKRYPELFTSGAGKCSPAIPPPMGHSSEVSTAGTDIRVADSSTPSSANLTSIAENTVHKAVLETTEAISEEQYLEQLLVRYMETVMRIAGAERGFLFGSQDNNLVPKIAGHIDTGPGAETGGTPGKDSLSIQVDILSGNPATISYAHSIVNISVRTGDIIDSRDKGLEQFRFDPYIQEQQPARLLCIPAKLYQEPRALLYLENDAMEADNRNNTIGLLISITTQVALSLESERLYARKEQLEKINKEQLFRLMQAEKSASVGFLVAEVAHEVNNPNQSILLNAAQLEEMWKDTVAILDEFCREEPLQIGGLSYSRYRTAYPQMVRAIKSSAVQIDSLVNELREFMKPKLTLEKQQIDVNSVIESTILIASHFIKTATDHFTFRTGTVPQVSGDQQKLQQVVLNLIRNSCQALPHKQASIEICTRYDAENKLVIIEVEDKGCGIEQDCLDKITEPFFSTKNDENGMGLGLYVCNSIVHEHGGTLHIESQPGFGTRVEVSLPCPL